MTAMAIPTITGAQSRGGTERLARARRKPGGRGERRRVLGQHARQPREHIGQVGPHIDFQAAAVLHDGVENGASMGSVLAW